MCHFYRKKLRTSVHYFVHLNLAMSLLLAFIVFVVGLETAIGSTVSFSILLKTSLAQTVISRKDVIQLSVFIGSNVTFNTIIYSNTGRMCICGSTFALPLPFSLLLDAL